MSDVLDRAFESLTRDLAHAPAPGAAAAMATARTRRRTRVGSVALATLVVVGGGLTVPGLLFPEDGVAADGGSARFDTAALADATDGWIEGWNDWERYSPQGAGSFGVAPCSSIAQARNTAPDPTRNGSSRFVADERTSARFAILQYADAETAASAEARANPDPNSCGTTTTYDVDGLQVRHDSVAPEGEYVGRGWLGDTWSVQAGDLRATMEVITTVGVADSASAEDIAEALVAGLRDGWTQSGMDDVEPQPSAARGPFPEWDDVDLEGTFAGWRSPTKRAATTSPNLLCLHDRLDGNTAGMAAGGSRWGLSYRVAGYLDPAEARANVTLVLDQLRACSSTEVTIETLPNGVHLATYDTGGPEPYNAMWIVAEGDRAAMVAVERADRPVPAGVPEDVGDAVLEILAKPWD